MTARDRMVLTVVVAVAALAAFWFLLLSPKRDEAKSLDGQIATTQSQLSSAQASIAQSQVAARSYPSSYATLARLGKAVPTDPQVPSLVYELNSAAQSQSVAFQSIQATGATNPASGPPAAASAAQALAGGLQPMPFTFTFNGDFFRLATFFRRIDALVVSRAQRLDVSGRLLSVDSLSLQPGPGGFPRISAQVQATAFLLPQQALPALPVGVAAAGRASPSPRPSTGSRSGGLPRLPAASISGATP